MKWGQHIFGKIGARRQATKQAASTPVRGRRLSEMSAAELQARIDRLTKEKTYRQLIAELTPQKESRAKKYIGEVLASGGKTITNAAFQQMANNMFPKANKPQQAKKKAVSP